MMTTFLRQFAGSRKLTPGHHRFKYPSQKMGMTVVTEYVNECHFCEYLEFDSRVKGFISQPKTITYDLYQEAHTYTADFLVDFYGITPIFYEIKPKIYSMSNEDKDKFSEIKYAYNALGFDFILVTANIFNNYKFKNMVNLRRFVNHLPSNQVIEFILFTIKKSSQSIASILDILYKEFNYDEKQSLTIVFQVIANKYIHVDIDSQLISRNSILEVYDESKDRYWHAVPIEQPDIQSRFSHR